MSELVEIERKAKTKQNKLQDNPIFGSFETIVEGWYWVLKSKELKAGQVKPIKVMGRELIVYRGKEDGVVRIMDAYCLHMGAHLAEGRVEGNSIRCFFHHWKFSEEGKLTDIPCQKNPIKAQLKTWPAAEKYGMIWVWTGKSPRHPVPYVPEIGQESGDTRLGNQFVKGCHPNIVMVNAIDEQHFHSVHPLASSLADGLHFEISEYNENCLLFDNSNKVPQSNLITRLMSRFYENALCYRMVYWNGSTGSVTVGPDFFHFHIIFALRPNDDGTASGQTILITKKRHGFVGKIVNFFALMLSEIVGNYFAKGDTQVFQTIRWDFKNPIKADRAIMAFMQHLQRQKTVLWGCWDPVDVSTGKSDSWGHSSEMDEVAS